MFETSPQNVSGVTDPSSSQNSTKKPSTVDTESTNSRTSSLQHTFSQQSSTGINRRRSGSFDDRHTSKDQAIDQSTKILDTSASTDDSIGINLSTSTDNAENISMGPSLSVINHTNQLDGDSEMIQQDQHHFFTSPTHRDPPNPR